MRLKYFSLALFLLCFGSLDIVVSDHDQPGIRRSPAIASLSSLGGNISYGAIAQHETSCCFDIESLQQQVLLTTQNLQNSQSRYSFGDGKEDIVIIHRSSTEDPYLTPGENLRAAICCSACVSTCCLLGFFHIFKMKTN